MIGGPSQLALRHVKPRGEPGVVRTHHLQRAPSAALRRYQRYGSRRAALSAARTNGGAPSGSDGHSSS